MSPHGHDQQGSSSERDVVERATAMLRNLVNPFRAPQTAAEADPSASGHPPDKAVPGQQQPDLSAPARPAWDSELAAVFAEEARQLLARMGGQLDALSSGDMNQPAGQALLRDLHTLKGSARVAGAETIAATCHRLEQQLNDDTAAGRSVSPQSRASLDRLHRLCAQLPLAQDVAGETMGQKPDPAQAPRPRSQALTQSGRAGVEISIDAGMRLDTPAQASEVATFSPRMFWEADDAGASVPANETVRVPAARLDGLLEDAAEVGILGTRLEQHTGSVRSQLDEVLRTTARLREQVNELQGRLASPATASPADADTECASGMAQPGQPSGLQNISTRVAETLSDLTNLQQLMSVEMGHSSSLLVRQARAGADLQRELMRSLMVAFSGLEQRLGRVVALAGDDSGHAARMTFTGTDEQLDRNVLEQVTGPLEHLLRNAVVHGIETGHERRRAGKPEVGQIRVDVTREAAQLAIAVTDDGRGLDLDAVRRKAVDRGLIAGDAQLQDTQLAALVLEPGFSTAGAVTQSAGRGVGLDAVHARIRQLGGQLAVTSETGQGTRFRIRLPSQLALSQCLLVRSGANRYALPLGSIDAVMQSPHDRLAVALNAAYPEIEHAGRRHQLYRLADLLDCPVDVAADEQSGSRAVLLATMNGQSLAFAVDAALGRHEFVVKSVGPHLAAVPGITGATMLADGAIVFILDLAALSERQGRRDAQNRQQAAVAKEPDIVDQRPQVMVVDDSITVRRATAMFLADNGYRALLARDGLDARAQLRTQHPAAIILDIDMPGLDGFELADHIRQDAAVADTPIIMVTARSSDKYRRRARQLNVDAYMTKPCDNADLLVELRQLAGQPADASGAG